MTEETYNMVRLMGLNHAQLLILNKKNQLSQAWAEKGSVLYRAHEILEHAYTYLGKQTKQHCEQAGY